MHAQEMFMIPEDEKERLRRSKEDFARNHPTEIQIIQHLDELYNKLDSENPLERMEAQKEMSFLLAGRKGKRESSRY